MTYTMMIDGFGLAKIKQTEKGATLYLSRDAKNWTIVNLNMVQIGDLTTALRVVALGEI